MESLEEREFMFMEMDEQYHHPSVSVTVEDLWWENNTDSHHDSPDTNSYWDSQILLLQEILERYQSSESKLRREVGRIIKEVKGSDFCSCLLKSSDCTTCLRRRVVDGLCEIGFSTNLCISKWGTTKKCPGGCHEYIEVIANTSTRKKKIHFLVELELREQFQIAKANEKYEKLVSCLPEFYIGKPEYLNSIVRVMCNAAKKSMREKKMHVGPWRKSSFMQMKWSGFNAHAEAITPQPNYVVT